MVQFAFKFLQKVGDVICQVLYFAKMIILMQLIDASKNKLTVT